MNRIGPISDDHAYDNIFTAGTAPGFVDSLTCPRDSTKAGAVPHDALAKTDTKAFRESVLKPAIENISFSNLALGLRKDLEDDLMAEEINVIFSQMPGSGLMVHNVAEELALVLPFGHDRAVRMALQVTIMLVVVAAIFGISLYASPVIAALVAAAGTPKPTETWKAVGNAYDRLYGEGQYHPTRARKTKKNSTRALLKSPE